MQPRFTLQYEVNEEIARQAGVDLWEFRLAHLKAKHPEWGTLSPLIMLLGAAAQILVAMAAVAWIGEWNVITQTLVVLGIIVIAIVLLKVSFYALPFLGRWLGARQSVRQLRQLAHHRITWRLYDERLETESAATQRRIPWSEVSKMALVGQSLLLALSDKLVLAIPTSVLTEEAQQFLASRIQ